MAAEPWSVLVVDDEPPIRAELRYLLSQDARVGTTAEAGNVSEAAAFVMENNPDVLFLDIQMPGRSGMELAETLAHLRRPPAVVFVTAFSEYAANAYELDAVDYVMKPVEQARLIKALDKVELSLRARSDVEPGAKQPARIMVEREGRRAFIPSGSVCCIEAAGDNSNVVCSDGVYFANESISSFEARLAGEGFLRVHRSYLVNLDDVRDVEINKSGLMELKLARVNCTVPVSRRRMPEVKQRLGIS